MGIHMLKHRKLIVFILCLSLIIPSMMYQNMILYAGTKGICIASKLMIRTGPGQDYQVVKVNGEEAYLSANQIVDILSSENGWYKIKAVFNNIEVEGYSSAQYIKQAEDAGIILNTKKGICTANILMIRKGPGTSYDKIAAAGIDSYLTNGQSVEILGEENEWYNIKASFMGTVVEGWSSSAYIRVVETSISPTPTKAPTITASPAPTKAPTVTASPEYELKLSAVVKASSVLNLRKTPGVSGEKIASLNGEQSITIIGQEKSGSENWYKVTAKVDGKTITGYVLSDYVKITVGAGFYANILKNDVIPVTTAGGTYTVKLEDESMWKVKKGRTWISDEITIDGQKWFRIGENINGTAIRGYVKADVIELLGKKAATTATPTPAPTDKPTSGTNEDSSWSGVKAIVTASSLNIRKEANTNSAVLGTLKNNDNITVMKISNNGAEWWYYITTVIDKKEIKGYVYSPYVKLDLKNPIEAVLLSSINIRAKASKNSAYVKNSNGGLIRLPKGSRLSIVQELTADSIKWFKADFTYEKQKYNGYLTMDQVDFYIPTPTPMPVPTNTPTPTPTKKPTPTPTLTPTKAPTPLPAVPSNRAVLKNIITQLTVREKPGYSSGALYDESGLVILMKNGTELKVISSEAADGYTWYKTAINYKGIEYIGYIREYYLEFLAPDNSDDETKKPVEISSDFEEMLVAEGFPESYKAYIRQIHLLFPEWQFKAYHTNLDWNTVIDNESGAGINLIPNSKGIEWKSTAEKAYNWKTDSFIVYDGSSWVTASKAAIEYYMDPRNFLDEKNIFQFEVLTYKPSYQNLTGVENILKNTAFYHSTYSFVDQYTTKGSITYGETFIKAAEYSGVSPYHLASRVKQEVVTGTTTISNSVSGTVSGFEGLFNFYNIGAYHSTVAGGNIANGLKYAKNGSTNAELNQGALIPWNNQYKSIVGGAYILGSSYINKGQDTIYMQKFNVTPIATYSHQYMANVEAPAAEGKKVYTAYGDNISKLPLVFSIPVYLNMPKSPVPVPPAAYNPNNWLNSLKVLDMAGNNLLLTPAFDITAEKEYYITVPKDTELISITAAAVSKKATVGGEGIYKLTNTTNLILLHVIAENGDIREYRITIYKES